MTADSIPSIHPESLFIKTNTEKAIIGKEFMTRKRYGNREHRLYKDLFNLNYYEFKNIIRKGDDIHIGSLIWLLKQPVICPNCEFNGLPATRKTRERRIDYKTEKSCEVISIFCPQCTELLAEALWWDHPGFYNEETSRQLDRDFWIWKYIYKPKFEKRPWWKFWA